MDQLHVFLSAPGDVSRERQLAREVIYQLESEHAYRDRLKLEVVSWDKPGADIATPVELEPQAAIDQGIKKPSECDILIVIFWSRMGTPLSENYRKPDGSCYRSGTEYAFIDAMNAAKGTSKPDVLVYRRLEEIVVGSKDPERNERLRQWDLVKTFFAEFRKPDDSYQSFCKGYNAPHELRGLLERDLRSLIERHLDATPPEALQFAEKQKKPSWDKTNSPFPGLRPFTPDEASIFYGRDREVDQLIQILSDSNNRFIAVVGTSGSGKSSLVSAGLLPALEKDAIPGSKDWVWLRFTPAEVGDNPFMAIARAFKPILERRGDRPREMAGALETDSTIAGKFFTMALDGRPEWGELVLFIDQFEEFFTLVNAKYQRAFVDLLALIAKRARLRAVVTMRSDFYHRCLDLAVLNTLVAKGHYPLLAPNAEALYEMITRPASRFGFRFEEGLVNQILNDTGTKPGAMAPMAFALYELWKISTCSDGLLTYGAYESFKGVHGAIGTRAEDAYRKHVGEAGLETTLSSFFRELVGVDERGAPYRRRARRCQVAGDKAAAALVGELTDARLLVTSEGGDNEPMVAMAHEAIFTHWPRLKDWIEVRLDDLRLLRQVRLAAAEWEKNGFLKHLLWPHERLVLVAQMVDRMRPVLNSLEEKFILPESVHLLKEIDDPATTHQQRVKIGDRLSEIGDPRPGVGLRDEGLPDILWCKVSGGQITLEKSACTFRVEPFYIAKYPVTWIQYRAFLNARDGYRNEHWWEGLPEREVKPGEQYRKQVNHPAENVSWYDAVAYCCWLSKKLGYKIKLPTEWEWQQAATGGNKTNQYPWGRDWDSERANTAESGLSRTTAVGLYPRGASPKVEALDMSGNVWEWCLNEYDSPKNQGLGGKKPRVVRGGSWGYLQNGARTTTRDFIPPNHRHSYLGFRLSCASEPGQGDPMP